MQILKQFLAPQIRLWMDVETPWKMSTNHLFSLGSHKTKETLRQKDWFKRKVTRQWPDKPLVLSPVAMLMLPEEQTKLLLGTASGIQTSTNSRAKFHDVNKKNSARNVPGLIWGTCRASVWILTRQLLFHLDIQCPRAAQTIWKEIQDAAERKSNTTTEKTYL